MRLRLDKLFMILVVMACGTVMLGHTAQASRIKDVVSFEGVRENMLVGYGLVVGLQGSGDNLINNAFTEKSLIAFLERQGVNAGGALLRSRNVAAVTVTGRLPAFARSGSAIDVAVSTMGDASSLLGGTLLATTLYGPDGNVYAVAQGSLTVGGFAVGGDDGTTISKGVPTNAQIPNGGIVEREVNFVMNEMRSMRLAMRNPDMVTAQNVSRAINRFIGPATAKVEDPGTVAVTVPTSYIGDVAGLMADIETLEVETDQIAKVVIDEATGTIVMGDDVRIDRVAVAQGNLVVRVEETPQVSQPNPFAPVGAETVIVPRTEIEVDEGAENKMAVLEPGATLRELVNGLNALGVGPRDLITILQTIKTAGALNAEVITR